MKPDINDRSQAPRRWKHVLSNGPLSRPILNEIMGEAQWRIVHGGFDENHHCDRYEIECEDFEPVPAGHPTPLLQDQR